MSIQRRKINGPLQAAYGRLSRNPELVRYLRACEFTFRKKTAALLLQACVEEYAPELLAPKTGTYNRSAYQEQLDKTTEDLMWRLRALRTQGQGTVSELIEKAIVRWLDRNVARVVTDPTNGIEWAVTHEEAAKRDAAWATEQEQAELKMQAGLDEARQIGAEADARDFAEAESLTALTGKYHEPIAYTSLKRLREFAATEDLTLEQYAAKYPGLSERIAEHEDQLHRLREDATMSE